METVSEFSTSGFRGRGSLRQIVVELQRQVDARVDFTVDTRSLEVSVAMDDTGKSVGVKLHAGDTQAREFIATGGMPVLPAAFTQVCGRVEPNVPVQFCNRLVAERPSRAVDLLNGLLRDSAKRVLVRSLDGKCRAFLSNRYRVLDNYDLALTAMQAADAANAEVIEGTLTDTNLRIKLVSRAIYDVIEERRTTSDNWYAGALGNQTLLRNVAAKAEGDLPGGPGTVWPAVTVRNSETGHGRWSVRLGILRGICFNLATVEDVVTAVHLGDELPEGVFTRETIQADNALIFAKARDAIASAFKPETFRRIVAKCKTAALVKVEAPTMAVESLARNAALTDERRAAILERFLGDGYGRDAWGIAQAVARVGQDVADADDAAELEDLAGRIIVAPERMLASTK